MSSHREDHLAIEPDTSFYAKRHEWMDARHEPPALSFCERGLIQDCSKSLEMLFGFRRSDLVWQSVSKLFPLLKGIELVQAGQVNPLLKYRCRCGQLYQAQNQQGDTFSCNLSIVRLEYEGRRSFRLIVRPV